MAMREPGVRLRAMSVGDILDETFKLYRRHFLTWVIATAIAVVPATLISLGATLVIGGSAAQGRVPSLETMILTGLTSIPLGIIAALVYLVGGAATVHLASSAALGHPVGVGPAYGYAFSRVLSLIWAGLLIGLAVGLVAITIIGIPFAIYLAIGWSLTTHAIVIEQHGGRAAMSRSAGLVTGHRWRTLGLLFITSILVSILVSLPTILVGGAIGAAATAASPGAGSFLVLETVNSLLSGVAQSLFGAVTWIVLTLLYYDLRIRKEAFDIEQRAASDPPSPPAYGA